MFEERKEEIGWIYYEDEVLKGDELATALGDIENYISVRQASPQERITMQSTLESQGTGETYTWNSAAVVDATKMMPSNFAGDADINTVFDLTQVGNLQIEDNSEVDLHWVFLGDIFGAILDQPNINYIMTKNNMIFMLGQAIMPDVLQGKSGMDPTKPILVNLADIPISLNVWNQFFSNEIVKAKITNLDLFGFIRMFVGRIINPMFNNRDTIGANEVMRSNTVTPFFYDGDASKVTKLFQDSNRKMFNNITDIYFGSQASPNPMRKELKSNIFFLAGSFETIGMGPINNGESWSGNENRDNQFGLMHYYLSRDRGFLKSATFTKSNIHRSREINVAASQDIRNATKPQTNFWEPFNVDIEFLGNPNIFFSSTFFIQPTLPGVSSLLNKNSPAYKLQIGGYHKVISIENKIDVAGWTTSVQAQRTEPISGKYASGEIKETKDRIYPSEVLS